MIHFLAVGSDDAMQMRNESSSEVRESHAIRWLPDFVQVIQTKANYNKMVF
jgi:hypothetical protein